MKTRAAFLALLLLLLVIFLGFLVHEETPECDRGVGTPPVVVNAGQPALENAQAGLAIEVITGIVKDSQTGAPIPGAIVEIETQRLVTDAAGVYVAREADCAPCSARASAGGYADQLASFHRKPLGGTIQNFALDPAISLLVTVVNQYRDPIPGARVAVVGGGSSLSDVGLETDEDGLARITYTSRLSPPALRAWKDGYHSSQTGLPSESHQDARVQIILRKTMQARAIVGRVTDPEGRPISDGQIVWQDGKRPHHVPDELHGQYRARTDEQGFYRLEFEDDNARCSLSVFATGWAPTIRFAVASGTPEEPAEMNFTLERGHWLEGRIVDEKSMPVRDAELSAMPTLQLLRRGGGAFVPYPGVLRTAKSDEEGKFRLEDLGGPTVWVGLSGSTSGSRVYQEEELEVDQTVDLVLRRRGVLRGRVVDAHTREPVQVFTVELASGIRLAPMGYGGESFTSTDGRFALTNLLQGHTFSMIVTAEGFVPAVCLEVPVKPEESLEEREVQLSHGRQLLGMVVDGRTGNALEDVKVVLRRGQDWERELGAVSWGSLDRLKGVQSKLTAPDGMFSFRETEPGVLFLHTNGYKRVIIRPEERARCISEEGMLRIPLEPGQTLAGVFYETGKPKAGAAISLIRLDSSASEGDRSQEDESASRERRQHFGWVRTDAEGRFRWDGLEPGTYLLEALRRTDSSLHAGVRMRRRVVVVAGEEKSMDIGDDEGSLDLSGRIVDPHGRPIWMGSLVLTPTFEWSYEELSVPAMGDQDAQFTLLGLKPGKYDARVELQTDSGVQLIHLDPITMSRHTDRLIVVRQSQ